MSFSELIWSDMFFMVEMKVLYWAPDHSKRAAGGCVGGGVCSSLLLLMFDGNLKVLMKNEYGLDL